MKQIVLFNIMFWLFWAFPNCVEAQSGKEQGEIFPASWRISEYLPLLKGKKVAVAGNQTSLIGNRHLVDSLRALGVNIVKIFGPEHGFRGNFADGSKVNDTVDAATGIPVISLYGNHKKPTIEDLKGVDLLLFDIQDVGCRFYTYLSTLTYMMEACAESSLPVILLDRPNPNGYYVDGPVLKPGFASFIGLHPVPVVYGMTIGEYALMVNGEKWLNNQLKAELTVISCSGYTHSGRYQLPAKPSPNLPTMKSVYLYPSLCLFEGTVVSVGRGTAIPFQVIGHPSYVQGSYIFTPESIPGISENPPLKGRMCYGLNLSEAAADLQKNGRIELFWLINMYNTLNMGETFFNSSFDRLAGTDQLRKQLLEGLNEDQIRASWKTDLVNFRKIRSKYLLYKDFD